MSSIADPSPSAAAPSPRPDAPERLRWPHAEAVLSVPAGFAERGALSCLCRGRPEFAANALGGAPIPADSATAWLQLYERHGEQAPAHARGRFAVAIVDRQAHRVFLATDRFGTHPWCHTQRDGRLLFSDRADLLAGAAGTISPEAVYSYLFHHMIPAPLTIFEEVQRLDAGHWLRADERGVDTGRWWRPVFETPARMDFAEARARFLELVEGAVRRAAQGGRVGAFLSGGTDSSTVAGMLCKVTGAPAETYSMGFDAAGYDEMEYARIAARHFGTHHHEYYVTPEDLLDGIPRVARHYDQPFGNSSAVPAWLCASAARRDGIDILLAGDGGDELFGGNARYAKDRIFGWYGRLPAGLRSGLLEPLLATTPARRLPLLRKAASYVEQARIPLPDRMHQYNLLVRLGAEAILAPELLARIDQGAPAQGHRRVWSRIGAGDDLNRMLAFDWKYTLADNDLPKILGTTSLAGLDVAFPLLDDDLVDFSLGLPLDFKLKGFRLRWFFKEALRGFLPPEIITKKKHGFGLPFGVWACRHAGLRELAGDTLAGLKRRDVIEPAFIDRLVDELLPAHPGYYGELVWILMMMELWLSSFESGT